MDHSPRAPTHLESTQSSAETGGKESGNLELVRALLGGLKDACLLLDGETRILYCNESAKELLMPDGRILGRKLDRIIQDRQLVGMTIQGLRERTVQHRKLTLSLPGRTPVPVVCVAAVLPLEMQPEEWVVRLTLRLENSGNDGAGLAAPLPDLELLPQLLGPLTVLQGHLENLLEDRLPGPIPIRESLVVMKRNVQRLIRIVDEYRVHE